MAKDGTNRGGARPGAGRPRKSIAEKIAAGIPGNRPVTKIGETNELAEMYTENAPEPGEYLHALQKNGKPLGADKIYERVYEWLRSLKVEKLVNPFLIEQYSMSVARWVQCEEAISAFGLLNMNQRLKTPMQSPFVTMSVNFVKQSNLLWAQIYGVVKENCQEDVKDMVNPTNDLMEQLLRDRDTIK